MSDLADLAWPASRSGEAFATAARHARVAAPAIEALDVPYGELEARLAAAAPALVRVGEGEQAELFVVVARSGGELVVLGPDLEPARIGTRDLIRRWCAGLEAPLLPEIERLLEGSDVPGPRRDAARGAILREALRARLVAGLCLVRPSPAATLRQELARARLGRRLAVFLGAHAVQYLAWVASWAIVGRAALEGRFDPGWFAAWALLLATWIPFRLIATSAQGRLAVEAGAVLKRKLLDAALELDPQSIRGEGVGSFLGRVIEAEAIESLALSGGTQALTAAIELAVAAFVLANGASAFPAHVALLAWTALVVLVGLECLRRRRAWTAARLGLTHDLVEKMVGHRTRLAQTPLAARHAGEDEALEGSLGLSRRMDAATAALVAFAPRGWLVLGVLGTGLAVVRGDPSPAAIAVGLGGVLLAAQALTRLAHGLAELGGAAIAWRAVAPLLAALSGSAPRGAPGSGARATPARATPASANGSDPEPAKLLQARDLRFTHPRRAQPVIAGLDLEVREGDRILLEGASGSGKSTLASLLCGLRSPDAGLLLLRGLDRQTIGAEAWRKRVAAAPQFHENHVLGETLLFNLLMGRRWPPRVEDVEEAERVCRELGLGDLLSRMPSGVYEMVGESGWQLSHGERSRLFLARALLQEGEVVVLDESFAALDPEAQTASLACALGRARTLLVIAHA